MPFSISLDRSTKNKAKHFMSHLWAKNLDQSTVSTSTKKLFLLCSFFCCYIKQNSQRILSIVNKTLMQIRADYEHNSGMTKPLPNWSILNKGKKSQFSLRSHKFATLVGLHRFFVDFFFTFLHIFSSFNSPLMGYVYRICNTMLYAIFIHSATAFKIGVSTAYKIWLNLHKK